jgi:hypothetical protein
MDIRFPKLVRKNLTALINLSKMASKSNSDRFIVKIDVRRWKEIAALLFYISALLGFVYGLVVYGLPSLL